MFGLKSCFVILVVVGVSHGQGININQTCVPPTTAATTVPPTAGPGASTAATQTGSGPPSTASSTKLSTASSTKLSTASSTKPSTVASTKPSTVASTKPSAATAGRKRRAALTPTNKQCITNAFCNTVTNVPTCQCIDGYKATNVTTCVPTQSVAPSLTKTPVTVLATSFLLAAIFKLI